MIQFTALDSQRATYCARQGSAADGVLEELVFETGEGRGLSGKREASERGHVAQARQPALQPVERRDRLVVEALTVRIRLYRLTELREATNRPIRWSCSLPLREPR
jgi:hypothetical protein